MGSESRTVFSNNPFGLGFYALMHMAAVVVMDAKTIRHSSMVVFNFNPFTSFGNPRFCFALVRGDSKMLYVDSL